jgi:hypothetical protein
MCTIYIYIYIPSLLLLLYRVYYNDWYKWPASSVPLVQKLGIQVGQQLHNFTAGTAKTLGKKYHIISPCKYIYTHVYIYTHRYYYFIQDLNIYSICMHALIHACLHVCLYAWIHACMHAWMFVCLHVSIHPCMCACVHVCMYVCMYGMYGMYSMYGMIGMYVVYVMLKMCVMYLMYVMKGM